MKSTRIGSLFFSLLLAISFLFISARIIYADTIVLKDGRTIRCDTVREEEKVVRYWVGDAMLTIARDKVERVERGGEKGEAIGANSNAGSNTGSRGSSATGASRLADLPGRDLLPG